MKNLIEAHMKRLRRLLQRPVCLASGYCNESIAARSHTISRSQSLILIAENNHVLIREINPFVDSDKDLLVFKKIGLNSALAFPGFCNKHDTALFKPLDQYPFIASSEQLLLQAYRCACREFYHEACQIDGSLSAAQIAELQGLPQDRQYSLTTEFEIRNSAICRGFIDAIAYKDKFEKLILYKSFNRLRSYVIHSISPPAIACAGSFSPDFLANGESLQDFTDFETNLQSLFVSAIPDRSGLFIVLSFFDDEAVAPTRFIEDLILTNNLTSRLIWFCMTRFENLVLKPSWWDKMPIETRDKINEAFLFNANSFDDRIPTFDRLRDLRLDEWIIDHQFWI